MALPASAAERRPRLQAFESVLKHMVHRPCGALNPGAPCMEKEEGRCFCSKHYPYDFNEQTTEGRNSYPVYRRSNHVRVQARVLRRRPLTRFAPHITEPELGLLAQGRAGGQPVGGPLQPLAGDQVRRPHQR